MRSILKLLVRFFVWCVLLTLAGCALDAAGLGPDLGDADRAGTFADGAGTFDGAGTPPDRDATISADSPVSLDGAVPDDAPSEVGPIATDGAADVVPMAVVDGASCLSLVPTGWSLVVYDVGGSTCPTGFAAHSVHGTPVVGADACPCTCAVTQPGSCAQGTLSTMAGQGLGNVCAQPWLSVAIAGSGCTPAQVPGGGGAPRTFQAFPLPGQGGTCSDAVQPDATKVSAPVALYCDVPGTSADAVCDGAAPTGFASCIARNGMTACPQGTPFVQRHLVEDSAALQCSACSACSVATTCASAVLTTYTDPACSSQGTPLTVDGTCTTLGGGGGGMFNVAAVTYAAAASSTCTQGTSTPAAQLANPRTICCR
jgi:hypothetical protein